ncbi:MAG: Gfo/Idh/MocA family protein [Sediminibacterium sp.]|jgi:predicted dehydrogenase
MSIIRWGMIGCGSVTEVKSGPAFNKVPNSKLMAVMRRDEKKVKDYAERHHIPYYFTNAEDVINHPEVDAIYIATPPKFHAPYAELAMRKGKPVYVEKPMALNVAECEKMKQFSNATGVKLVVAHYRRALPLFLKVKNLLAENYIGVVQKVNIKMLKQPSPNCGSADNWRVFPELAGGGLFYDLAPHQLDLLFFYFGDAISYHGKSENKAGLYPAEDHVAGTILLKNNILFNGVWDFTVSPEFEKDIFEIIGENGKISFPVFGNDINIQKNGVNEVIHFDPPMHNQQNLIEQIVNYFLGNGVNPCSADDALQSMRVMEAFVYGNNK